jgi:hypothetical protein
MLTALPVRRGVSPTASPAATSGDGSAIFSGLRRGSIGMARFERRRPDGGTAGPTGSSVSVFSGASAISTESGDKFVEKLGGGGCNMKQSRRSYDLPIKEANC